MVRIHISINVYIWVLRITFCIYCFFGLAWLSHISLCEKLRLFITYHTIMSQQYKKFLLAKTRVFYCFTERGFAEIMASNPGIDCRALGLLRRGVDMIVLRDTESNRSEWKNAKATFGYSEDQVIWKQSNKDWLFSTPLELELEEDLSMISDRISCHQDVLIVPRVVYPEFVAACNAHKLDFVGTLQNYHEGKGCLYTNNMVIDALNFEHLGVSVTTLESQRRIYEKLLIL